MASLNNGSRSTGLGSCCLTSFCPCVASWVIAEIAETTSCCASGILHRLLSSVTGTENYYGCYRSRLRELHGLREEPCADCCVGYLWELSDLCEEYREVKNRRLEMTIAFLEECAMTEPPPFLRGMNR